MFFNWWSVRRIFFFSFFYFDQNVPGRKNVWPFFFLLPGMLYFIFTGIIFAHK